MQLGSLVLMPTLAIIACSSGATTEDPGSQSAGGGGEGGVIADAGSDAADGAKPVECKTADDCPPKFKYCVDPVCSNGACTEQYMPVDTPCPLDAGFGVCRGDGECVSQ
jgi:hypothetical protein